MKPHKTNAKWNEIRCGLLTKIQRLHSIFETEENNENAVERKNLEESEEFRRWCYNVCIYANANGAICLYSIGYVKKYVVNVVASNPFRYNHRPDVGHTSTRLYTHLKLCISMRLLGRFSNDFIQISFNFSFFCKKKSSKKIQFHFSSAPFVWKSIYLRIPQRLPSDQLSAAVWQSSSNRLKWR